MPNSQMPGMAANTIASGPIDGVRTIATLRNTSAKHNNSVWMPAATTQSSRDTVPFSSEFMLT